MITKFKIFISGNQKELKEERLAVKEAILGNTVLSNFFDVFIFEELPAKGKPPALTYLKEVDDSNIYIGIIGNEYGIKGKDGLAPTEREFRRFLRSKKGKEILFYIKGRDDSKRDKDVLRLIKGLREDYIYKRFITTEELKNQILNSLISFLDEQGAISKMPFDSRICKEAKYSDLDEKEVKNFLRTRAIKLKVDIPKISIREFLIKTLKIVKEENAELKPTNTALLFFGKQPQEYIPQSEIRIARFRGTTRIEFIDSKEITGPIYKMLEEVEIFFKRNTRLANKIVEFKRVDIPEYPFEAIREAVINAIAHRDYTRRGAPIKISIFDDRVEVDNPGGLLPGLDIKNLEGVHETRNEKICSIFHETKDMERYGTGIRKMRNLMKSHGLKFPVLSQPGDFFKVTFYGPGDKILDLVPSIPKERQIDLKELGLNERQIEALRLMVNEGKIFTNREYRQLFKVTNKTASTDLNILVKKEMAQMRGEGRNREYLAK
jgi:predicted HTH transcriptional regulator